MDHKGIMQVRNEFLVANVTDMVFSLDEEGKFVDVNPASESITGFVPKELAKCHYRKIVLPDDLPIVEKQIHCIKSSKGMTSFEARVCTRKGKPCLCLWSAYWSESDLSMFCVVHDITAQRRKEDRVSVSELKVRTIIERMPAGLVLMAEGGILETCNPWLERISGYTAGEVAGKDATLLLQTNRTAPEIFAFLEEHRAGTVSAKLRKKDGTALMCDITATMLEKFDKARMMVCFHNADEQRLNL
jgi:PAS domain S-box-containing protein